MFEISKINTAGILVFILFLALGLDLLFYTGIYGSDDMSYYGASYLMASGRFDFSQIGTSFICDDVLFSFGGLRFAVTIPMAIIYYLTSGSVFWINMYFILVHLALVFLTFKTGKLIHNETIGWIASFLVATMPIFYVFAGGIFPDITLTFWILFSGYILFRFYKKRDSYSAKVFSFRTFLLLFTAGFSLGIAYSAKIAALIMFVPYFIIIAKCSKRFFSVETLVYSLYYFAGFLFFIGIETIWLSFLFEDFTIRINLLYFSSSESTAPIIRIQPDKPDLLLFYRDRFIEAHKDLKWALSNLSYFLLGLSIIIYPILKKSSRLLYIVFIWPLLYLIIGVFSFSIYSVSSIQPRYFVIIMPQLTIIGAFVIYSLYSLLKDKLSRNNNVARLILKIGIVCLLLFFMVSNFLETREYAGSVYRANMTKSFLAAYQKVKTDYPASKVFIDPAYARFQPLFLRNKFKGINDPNVHFARWRNRDSLPFFLISPRLLSQEALSPPYFRRSLIRKANAKLVDIVYPQNRWSVLSNFFRQSYDLSVNPIGSFPFCSPGQTCSSFPTYIYVFTEKTKPEKNNDLLFSSIDQKFPLFNVSKHTNIKFNFNQSGYNIKWGENDKFRKYQRKLNKWIQLKGFEKAHYKNPSQNMLGSFKQRQGDFKFSIDIGSLTDQNTKALVRIWLYHNAEYLGSKRSDTCIISPDKTTLKILFTMKNPIDQFRFSIYIHPESDSPGGIYIENLNLRSMDKRRSFSKKNP